MIYFRYTTKSYARTLSFFFSRILFEPGRSHKSRLSQVNPLNEHLIIHPPELNPITPNSKREVVKMGEEKNPYLPLHLLHLVGIGKTTKTIISFITFLQLYFAMVMYKVIDPTKLLSK